MSRAGQAQAPGAEPAGVSRRAFLRAGALAGSALVIGCRLPGGRGSSAAKFAPNAWLSIDGAGQVTIWVGKSEMGQGVRTSLPMIVAEELEADWASVRIEQAVSNPKLYGRQGTGGSSSVRRSFDTLRKAGAAGREMLLTAAAQQWGVGRETCRAEKGSVVHAQSGRRLAYGELVEAASKLDLPADPPLKDPQDFRIIGTRAARLDTPSKVDGSARYGIDVRVPGMLFAAVARCPVFGGKVASFDASKARAVPGVRAAVAIDSGVAVVAESTWAAFRGRDALEVRWDEGPGKTLDSAAIRRTFLQLSSRAGAVARRAGNVPRALAAAGRKLEAVYEVGYLSHSPMEPMNCTAHVRASECEVWAPTQVPNSLQEEAARVTGLPLDAVRVNVTLLGGGFGRRLEDDYGIEAVQISKAAGAPVQVVWTREDDTRHGFYRPASLHKLSGALDRKGEPLAWTHRVVAPSIVGQRWPEEIKNGLDPQAVSGAANVPYAFPNIRVDYVMANTSVPVGWWRAVYDTQNGFANECFVDEMAAAAGQDPYEFRAALLAEPRLVEDEDGGKALDTRRFKGVLDVAAARAGWGSPLPPGRGRGIAAHFSFGSYVAEVAEVEVSGGGQVRVVRVVCAVDCGRVINPDTVEAQIEGGVVYGLTAALKSEITIRGGGAEQSNFHDYEMLRIDEMPAVEVHIVPSSEDPGGIGEPGVPPIFAAVANAIHAATGKRARRLPIRPADLARA